MAMAMAMTMASLGSFFKIIMDSTSNNIRIPPEFTRRYGHDLPNRVFLKLPNGKKSFEVELNHVNGQTLIQRGWLEFVQRHSLGFGHLLMFEYYGNSRFNVRIFDKSAVEIDYPLESDDCDHDDHVLMLDDFSTAPGNQETALVPNDAMEISDDYHDPVYERSLTTTKIAKRDESTGLDCGSFAAKQILGAVKEMSIAYQKAVAFAARLNSPKTAIHIRLMQKSYVSGRFSLNLPLSFAIPSLPCTKATLVTMVMDGKKWSVRCLVSDTRVDATTGWRDYVNDNELKVGDVCIFVVANESSKQQPVWNVDIFRR